MHTHDLENIMYKWSSCFHSIFFFFFPICEFTANKGEILIIIHIFSSNQLQIRMLKIAGRHIAIFANLSSKMLIPTPWITLILITEMKEKMRTLLIMRNSVPIAFPRKSFGGEVKCRNLWLIWMQVLFDTKLAFKYVPRFTLLVRIM